MIEHRDSKQQPKPSESNERESENLYRTLFDNASDAILIHDMGRRFLEVNQVACDRLGYSREELLQMTPKDINGPGYAEFVTQRVAELLKVGHTFTEITQMRQDGTLIPTELSSRIIEYKGKPAVLSIARDITERKEAEEALNEQYSTLEGITSRSEAPIFSVDRRYRYTGFNKAHAAVMKAIYGKDIELGQSLLDYMTVAVDREEAKRNLDRTLAGEHVVEEAYSGEETRSRLCFEVSHSPIMTRDGSIIGAAVFAKDVTQRKRIENEIVQERDRARQYFDVAGVMMLVLDRDGNVAQINRKGCDILGYRDDEIIGRNWFDTCLPSNVIDDVKRIFADLMNGNLEAHELVEERVITRTGEERIIAWHNAILRDATGRIVATLSSGNDITERKRMEEEISSLARFPSENPNPVLRLDRQGAVLSANEASKPLLQDWGSGIGRVAPKSWCDLVTDALSTGQSKNIDIEFGGKSYTFLVKPTMEAGYVNLYGRDITERKKADEALRENEERYRLLIERQKEGLSIIDLEERFVFCNPAGEEVFGVPHGNLVGRNVREFTTPETFELVKKQTEKRRSGESSSYEIEITRPNGEKRQLLTTATPWLDKDGRIVGALAIFRDETDRKRIEEEARSLARFPAENPNPVLRLDKNGIVLATNEASKTLLRDWKHEVGQAAPKFWRDLASEILSTGRSKNIDVESDGKFYSFFVKPNTEAGYVNLYGRDITKRKQAEEALRRRAEELAALQATVLDITGRTRFAHTAPDYR